MTDHQATPEQWASLEATQARADRDFNYGSSDSSILVACILELRARLELLEATQHAHVDLSSLPEGERQQMLDSLRKPAKIQLLPLEQGQPQLVTPPPAGSLVERVAAAIADNDAPVDLWHDDARAAIREVAAWLLENDAKYQMGGDAAATADLLDQEADRG